MPDPRMPSQTLYKTSRESKTFCFDFTRTGPVVSGEVLSDPVLHIPLAAGVTVAANSLQVITADFLDAADGKKVLAGKGVKFQALGGVPGIYEVSCDCLASPSNDRPEIVGRLIITASPG